MANKDDIEYFLLTKDHFEEVVAQIDEDFCHREPICRGTHIDGRTQARKGRLGEEIEVSIATGLSVGARDRGTGKLVGHVLCELVDRNNQHQPTQPANECEIAYRIMDHVMHQVYNVHTEERILTLMFLSVREAYERRGIAFKMIQKGMEAAYARGAQVACGGITNIYSRKVCEKLGFEIRYTLDYKDPAHDIEIDLSRMHGNDRCLLMTKKLP